MTIVFLSLFEVSAFAAVMILGVILLRAVLRRAPRRMICLMWGLVALRLLLPLSVEVELGILPMRNFGESGGDEYIFAADTDEVVVSDAPVQIPDEGAVSENAPDLPVADEGALPDDSFEDVLPVPELPVENEPSADTVPSARERYISPRSVFLVIRITGSAVMAAFGILAYVRMRRRIAVSVGVAGNIRLCDGVPTPFIFGIIRPKIVMPSDISERDMEYVLLHEREHLRCLDHIWKPLGFAVLALHWFDPFVWVAYVLFCRDMEYACDAAVVGRLDIEGRRAYSRSLLDLSVPDAGLIGCPVAFGEIGVKGRVKSVMSYKKPALWAMIAAAICAVMLMTMFLTGCESENGTDSQSFSEYDGVSISIEDVNYDFFETGIDVKFSNNTDSDLSYGNVLRIWRKTSEGYVDCSLTYDRVVSDEKKSLPKGGEVTAKYPLSGFDMMWGETYLLETEVYDGENTYTVGVEFATPESPTGKEVIESVGSGEFVADVQDDAFEIKEEDYGPVFTEDGVIFGNYNSIGRITSSSIFAASGMSYYFRGVKKYEFTMSTNGELTMIMNMYGGRTYMMYPVDVPVEKFADRTLLDTLLEHNRRVWVGEKAMLFEQNTGNLYVVTYECDETPGAAEDARVIECVFPLKYTPYIKTKPQRYDPSGFAGRVTAVSDEYVMIRPDEGESMRGMTDTVSVARRTDDPGTTGDYQVGDHVRVDIIGGMLIKTDFDGSKVYVPQSVKYMYVTEEGDDVGYDAVATDLKVSLSNDETLAPSKYGKYNGEVQLPLWEIDSTSELDSFMEKYNEDMYLSVRRIDSDSFENRVATCDEEFFETGRLYVIYLTTNCSTILYEIEDLAENDGTLEIPVKRFDDASAEYGPTAHLILLKVPDRSALGDIDDAVAYLEQ